MSKSKVPSMWLKKSWYNKLPSSFCLVPNRPWWHTEDSCCVLLLMGWTHSHHRKNIILKNGTYLVYFLFVTFSSSLIQIFCRLIHWTSARLSKQNDSLVLEDRRLYPINFSLYLPMINDAQCFFIYLLNTFIFSLENVQSFAHF